MWQFLQLIVCSHVVVSGCPGQVCLTTAGACQHAASRQHAERVPHSSSVQECSVACDLQPVREADHHLQD